ncbi:MAG: NAD(P)-dependent oxidoreductase [Nitrososphaera sp.]
MTKVLLTGALGVLGTYISKYLKDKGYGVIGADLAVADYGDYVRADVTSFEDLFRVFRREKIDTVVHMAGEVGRMVGEEHPQRMIYVNDTGTLNIIRLCLEYNSKLVYFSTSEVYGHLLDKKEPVVEEELDSMSPFMTTNIYALSKLFGEAIVKHYVDNYGLHATTLRPFMIYGEGERPSKYRSAISNFIHNALTGQKIVVHRGAVRSWCYVSDLAQGLLLCIERQPTGKYEAFNIGSDEYHTMEEVAHMIIEETGASKDLIQVTDPPHQFLSVVKMASIEKARALGYEPKVPLRDGIRKVIAWQKATIR